MLRLISLITVLGLTYCSKKEAKEFKPEGQEVFELYESYKTKQVG